jgi:hypothetical protein
MGRARRSSTLRVLAMGALLLAPVAARAESRTEFLINQLKTSDDFRVRTQAALALGATAETAAVQPLCGALDDSSEAVRGASAAALGKLAMADGLPCLKTREGSESNGSVKSQISKAIKAIEGGGGSPGNGGGGGEDKGSVPANAKVYVAVGKTNNKTTRGADEIESLVRSAMTTKLQSKDGYAVAPKDEKPDAAKKVIGAKKLKGFHLQATVDPPQYDGDRLTVVVRVVMSTYPGKDIKGEFAPKLTQSGTPANDKASEDALIKMAIEKAVDSFDRVVASMLERPELCAFEGWDSTLHANHSARSAPPPCGARFANNRSEEEMATSAAPPAPAQQQKTGRHQRSLKNYLIDPAFQLKYTSYLVAISVFLSAALGLLLWRTSDAVIKQSREAVTQGMETVRRGQKLVEESRKVSAVVRMNISKEYADQPDLAKIFNEQADDEAKRLEEEQKRLKSEAGRLTQQGKDVESYQATILATLVVTLTLLIVMIGMAGIIITHKVAGPIFKMKRQIRELGEGHMRMPGKLRKGDELVHFFDTFEETVRSLRARQEAEIKKLDAAIAEMEGGADKSKAITALRDLRDHMQAELQ